MADEKKKVTFAGLKALEDELFELKINKRKENAEKLKEAREQGDLSENAEYDAAKNEQVLIEARIDEIEKILKNIEVIDEDDIDYETVNLGCKVTIYDPEFDENVEYYIVGTTEVDTLNGKISNESPLGSALMGRRAGEKIEVETLDGTIGYEIVSIEKAI